MKLKCLLVPFKSKRFTKPCTKLPQIFKFSFKFKKLICIRGLTCHRQHRSRPSTKTVKTTHRKNRIRGFFSIFRRRKRSTTTTTNTSTSTSTSTTSSRWKRRRTTTTSTTSSTASSSRRSLFSIFRRRGRQGRRNTSVVEVEEEIEDELGDLRNMTTAEAAVAGPQEKKIFPSPVTPAFVRLISGSNKNKVRGGQNNFDDVDDACRSFETYLVEMIVEEGKLSDLMDVEELLYCWKNLRCPVFRDMICRFYGELCRELFSSVDYDVEEKESSSIDDHHFK